MTLWLVEPLDPLIARDGKPFGVGVRAATLPFPFPSTITGGVRTRAGLHSGVFDPSRQVGGQSLIEAVKQIRVRGPLLVSLKDNEVEDWLIPAPADAVLFESNSEDVEIRQVLPLDAGVGLTNLDQAPHGHDWLVPVGFVAANPRKPYDKAPRFWRWDKFRAWLVNPAGVSATPIALRDLGHGGAVAETRTHVAVDPESFAALEGQLFQTRGLEFTDCYEKTLEGANHLALAVLVDEDANALSNQMKPGLAPLGGERRIVSWRESTKSFPDDCVAQLQEHISQDRACRLVLLTPAHFTDGSSPTWLRSKQHGVDVELAAIAGGRTQVVSGWDFALVSPEHRGGLPKPTRRLAPAGSVFFLRLRGEDAAINTWVSNMWMHCVSDDATLRNDGFGLAALGVWNKDGRLEPMKGE